MNTFKTGRTQFTRPSCGGGFDPATTGLEVLENGSSRKQSLLSLSYRVSLATKLSMEAKIETGYTGPYDRSNVYMVGSCQILRSSCSLKHSARGAFKRSL